MHIRLPYMALEGDVVGLNGISNGDKEDAKLEEDGSGVTTSTTDIPPAGAHVNGENMTRITIPLNNVPAFTPSKELQVVIIGAGYAGVYSLWYCSCRTISLIRANRSVHGV